MSVHLTEHPKCARFRFSALDVTLQSVADLATVRRGNVESGNIAEVDHCVFWMILRKLKSVVFEFLGIPISPLIPDDRRCASSLVIGMLVEVRLKVLWPFLLIAE